MSDPQEVEKDLKEYLAKESNLRKEDRLIYLRTILEKHLTFKKMDHIMTYNDFQDVLQSSKNEYVRQKLPMYISRKRIESNELNYVAMIESFVGYLSKNNLIKKSVKIDYTE